MNTFSTSSSHLMSHFPGRNLLTAIEKPFVTLSSQSAESGVIVELHIRSCSYKHYLHLTDHG
jgi:hypothetical protein